METRMRGEFGPNKIAGEVWNVSINGLLLRTQPNALALNKKILLTVQLSDNVSTSLEVEALWCTDKILYGIRVLKPTAAWTKMIEFLENDYDRVETPILKIA